MQLKLYKTARFTESVKLLSLKTNQTHNPATLIDMLKYNHQAVCFGDIMVVSVLLMPDAKGNSLFQEDGMNFTLNLANSTC